MSGGPMRFVGGPRWSVRYLPAYSAGGHQPHPVVTLRCGSEIVHQQPLTDPGALRWPWLRWPLWGLNTLPDDASVVTIARNWRWWQRFARRLNDDPELAEELQRTMERTARR